MIAYQIIILFYESQMFQKQRNIFISASKELNDNLHRNKSMSLNDIGWYRPKKLHILFLIPILNFASWPSCNPKLCNSFLGIKTTISDLLKPSCSGVNFTIILQAKFTHADPKSEKKTVKSSSFLRCWDLRL